MTAIRIGVVLMHHPSRGERINDIVAACRPLRARIVEDPDPDGPPSPLRTAKLAWSAVDPTATHHLVLQDDVVLPPGFAAHLHAAVASHPTAAVALYVNWNSPQNAYLSRRAAAAGSAWAPLSRWEYTPALGLVVPAEQARALGRQLAALPDDLRDDDESISQFCRWRDIDVVATVPNLVDHCDGASLAGYDNHGARRSVAYVAATHLPVAHWAPLPAVEAALRDRVRAPRPTEFVVELLDSQCMIRFLRPGSTEPVDHPYGWHWLDWCPLIGAEPGRIIDSWSVFRRTLMPEGGTVAERVLAEVWAAGYLLGADAASSTADGTFSAGRLARPDVQWRIAESWIESGLARHDRLTADPRDRRAATDCCVEAIRCGMRDPLGLDSVARSTADSMADSIADRAVAVHA